MNAIIYVENRRKAVFTVEMMAACRENYPECEVIELYSYEKKGEGDPIAILIKDGPPPAEGYTANIFGIQAYSSFCTKEDLTKIPIKYLYFQAKVNFFDWIKQ